MRLLLLTRHSEDHGLAAVRNFSGVWSHFLPPALRRQGAEVHLANVATEQAAKTVDLSGVDHVIALGTGTLDRSPELAAILKRRCRGMVTQTHDRPSRNSVADCTFTVRDDQGVKRNHRVGWAADPAALEPAQSTRELRVLVDHPDYVQRHQDASGWVLRQVAHLVRARLYYPRWETIRVRRIVDGGFEDCDFRPITFSRCSVSYEIACQEYRAAHLFMVTHRESVGLTALEVALAGGLVVVPGQYILPELRSTIRHVGCKASAAIDWRLVLSKIDPAASRRTAAVNSWDAVAGRMLEWFAKC